MFLVQKAQRLILKDITFIVFMEVVPTENTEDAPTK